MLHFNVRGKGLILLRQECYSHTKTVADFPLQNKESFVIITKLCFAAESSPSSSGQDAALSRRKHGFNSRWGHHNSTRSELLYVLTFFIPGAFTPPKLHRFDCLIIFHVFLPVQNGMKKKPSFREPLTVDFGTFCDLEEIE